jgi:hypothetical protein
VGGLVGGAGGAFLGSKAGGALSGLFQSDDNEESGMGKMASWLKDLPSSISESSRELIRGEDSEGRTRIQRYSEAISAISTSMLTTTKDTFNNVISGVKDTITNLASSIRDTMVNVKDRLIENVSNTVTNLVSSVRDTVTNVKNSVVDKVSTTATNLVSSTRDVLSNVKNSVVDKTSNTVTNLVSSVRDNFVETKDRVVETATGLGSSVVNGGRNLLDGAGDVASNISKRASMGGSVITGGVSSMINNLRSGDETSNSSSVLEAATAQQQTTPEDGGNARITNSIMESVERAGFSLNIQEETRDLTDTLLGENGKSNEYLKQIADLLRMMKDTGGMGGTTPEEAADNSGLMSQVTNFMRNGSYGGI